jgi:hypothetical protein
LIKLALIVALTNPGGRIISALNELIAWLNSRFRAFGFLTARVELARSVLVPRTRNRKPL